MNWLTNLPPGLKSIFAKREDTEGDNLWVKCPKTGELVYRQELESSYWVTPAGAHRAARCFRSPGAPASPP